ncbi:MAG: SDR family oxidoreductase [Vampirovibrionales bacterium]|nr:SDR family oxidoreductase [Vampirovibrionales bacterium]
MPEQKDTTAPNQVIAVVGATGYVGGRLVPLLLAAGYRVRAVGRSLVKLQNRPWAHHDNIELVSCDVLDANALDGALAGCSAAYYLVHSMSPLNRDFAQTDRIAAEQFRDAAGRVGLKRIIYLSGLGEDTPKLSKHLQSRAEVARILQTGPVPVTVLRAAMIIGSGSASFEILRYLVDRLPVMATPSWVRTPSQPIAIRNVLGYLIGCLQTPEIFNAPGNETYDIGGPDVLSYEDLIVLYARVARLAKRWIIPVPVMTPRLSSYWIHFVTPISAALARPLTEGLRNPVVCQENRIRDLIPQELISCEEAIARALERTQAGLIETHWSDAGPLYPGPEGLLKPLKPPSVPAGANSAEVTHSATNLDAAMPPEQAHPGDPSWAGGTVFTDTRELCLLSDAGHVWPIIVRIGGNTGYYYGNWLWRLRGLLDVLFGGYGLRRGRRHPTELRVGDALDFWRVIDVVPDRRLLLRAEMKLPGTAFLSFDVCEYCDPKQAPKRLQKRWQHLSVAKSSNRVITRITQTATFIPKGLPGILYWYAVMPLHHFVFNGMLFGIAVAGGFQASQCVGPLQVTPEKSGKHNARHAA